MIDTKHPCIEFTANDRCDRCPARAYVAYRKDSYELLFCLHHAKENNLALEAEGWQPFVDYVGIEGWVKPEPVPA